MRQPAFQVICWPCWSHLFISCIFAKWFWLTGFSCSVPQHVPEFTGSVSAFRAGPFPCRCGRPWTNPRTLSSSSRTVFHSLAIIWPTCSSTFRRAIQPTGVACQPLWFSQTAISSSAYGHWYPAWFLVAEAGFAWTIMNWSLWSFPNFCFTSTTLI